MPSFRQLAAIMFTDIEGYTAIMQQSEQRALFIKKRHREILETQHKQFNGRIIQYYGDGTLSIFQSAVQAVQCALAIQQAFCSPPEIPVRVGLHIGDVVFDDEQVVGDGVNLASRIESLGVPGCVLLSDRVKDEIMNHPELKTVSVGTYQFKNIERMVEVFALDHVALVKPKQGSLTGKTEEKINATHQATAKNASKSVAVLPFVNMSNDPEQEYFSEGIAEEIINSLVHIKDLKIAGRTSSARFKGRDIDLVDVGEKLSVGTVLKGSLRKQGNRVRITVQLVNVKDGFVIWSEKYDRDMDDIFAIQDEIAIAITEQLKVTLFEKDRETITKNATYDAKAYELYLKGRFYMSRRGSSIITGLHYFKQSIATDPGFAWAYCGCADANMLSAFYSFSPGNEVMKEIKQAAETARQLDNSLGEAYFSLAAYHEFLEWNWMEAKRNYLKAVELSPKVAQIHAQYGMCYLAWVEGKFDEAEKHEEIAINLEPLSAIDHADYSWVLYTANKFEKALLYAKTGIELDANSFLSQRLAGLCYLALNRYDEAIETFIYLMKISNGHQHAANSLIWAYCSNGNLEKATELIIELEKRSVTEYIARTNLGISAAYLGDLDTALNFLEKAYDDRDPVLITLKYSPAVPASLRRDLRFQNLLERIGFPA